MIETPADDWKAAARRKLLQAESDAAASTAKYRMLADRREDLGLLLIKRRDRLAAMQSAHTSPASTDEADAHIANIRKAESDVADLERATAELDEEIARVVISSRSKMKLRDAAKKLALQLGIINPLEREVRA